jgi:predicted small lipoprotein YifL
MSGVGRRGLSPQSLDLLSLPPIQERHAVTSRFTHIAVIGAVAAAVALGGCGRKGPLDPPPLAGAAPPAQAAGPNVGLSPVAEQPTATPAAFDAQGRPIAPSNAPKKRLPMDWLLD